MNIENQVCTMQQGKKLAELGVKEASLFHWFKNESIALGEFWDLGQLWNPDSNTYNAYTVAELLHIIGRGTKTEEKLWQRLMDGINAATGLTSMLKAPFVADFLIIHLTQ